MRATSVWWEIGWWPSASELRESTLQLTVYIGRQVSKALVLKRSKLMACLVAFLVKVLARREGGWDIRSRRLSRSRHGLLTSYQLIVNIGAEFMELSGGKAQELIAGLVGPAAISIIAT